MTYGTDHDRPLDHAYDAIEAYDGDIGALIRDCLSYLGHDSSERAPLDTVRACFYGELGNVDIRLVSYSVTDGIYSTLTALPHDHPITVALAAVARAADAAD